MLQFLIFTIVQLFDNHLEWIIYLIESYIINSELDDWIVPDHRSRGRHDETSRHVVYNWLCCLTRGDKGFIILTSYYKIEINGENLCRKRPSPSLLLLEQPRHAHLYFKASKHISARMSSSLCFPQLRKYLLKVQKITWDFLHLNPDWECQPQGTWKWPHAITNPLPSNYFNNTYQVICIYYSSPSSVSSIEICKNPPLQHIRRGVS